MPRSLHKGPYIDAVLSKKVAKVKASGKREAIKTYSRACMIVPDFVGLTIAVHDGRKFASIFVTENMVGHKLGEFAPTRTFRAHSGQRQTEKASSGPAAPAAQTAASAAPKATVKK